MSARPFSRGARNARRAFKAYVFDDGGSIWRHVQPVHVDASGQTVAYPNGPNIRDPKSFSVYARFDVFEPYVKIGSQPQPRWIDSVIYTEGEPASYSSGPSDSAIQTLRSVSYPHAATNPIEKTNPLLISFFRNAGVHSWIGGSLPYALEVDDRLQSALDRTSVSVSALGTLQGGDRSEQACRKRMEEAIDKLEHELSPLKGFKLERGRAWETRRWRASAGGHDFLDDRKPIMHLTITQDGMNTDISLMRYIDYEDDEDQDRWKVTVTMDGFGGAGRSRNNLVQALSDAVVEIKNLRLVTFSEAEAFWATYNRPGDFTFDTSTFRLLGVRNPVFLHDDDFVTWAVAAGLEEANFTEYPPVRTHLRRP